MATAKEALSCVVKELVDKAVPGMQDALVQDAHEGIISALDTALQKANWQPRYDMCSLVTTMKRKYDELEDEVEQMEQQMNQIRDLRDCVAFKRDRIKLVADTADELLTYLNNN
jgi:hypothetical protein